MGRHPYGDGDKPGTNDGRYSGGTLENYGQGAGEKSLNQSVCCRRDRGCEGADLVKRMDMRDERIVCRSFFGFEYQIHSLMIEGIPSKAVDCFRWECSQLTT